jgi:osmoprotectant transport system substrate-binding protein
VIPGHGRAAMATVAIASLVGIAACTSGPSRPPVAPGAADRSGVITVGSFDFPESEVLAQIYGQALRAAGYRVEVLPSTGPRELMEPSLGRGLVQLIPEYQGSALAFLSLGRDHGSPDAAATHVALQSVLAPRGLVALDPAPAQDANAIVVTQQTARRFGLRSLGDLAPVASRLRFGGPPECPQRDLCLLGLKRTYGLTFGQFIPLDTGGPLTLQALKAGEIDVALLFTTDPGIQRDHLVVLADDRGLQPAENVTPIVRRDTLDAFGPSFAAAMDAVSQRLTTDELRSLDALIAFDGRPPAAVAASWLRSQGLLGAAP